MRQIRKFSTRLSIVCSFLVGTLVAFHQGAGAHIRHSPFKSWEEKPAPIVIGVSGYKSCKGAANGGQGRMSPLGSSIHEGVVELTASLSSRYGKQIDFMTTCFISGEPLVMIKSWEDEIIYDLDEEVVRAEIVSEILRRNPRDVYLIGHSWGGWMLLDIVRQFDDGAGAQQLYTIDPISKVYCHRGAPVSCTDAPLDIRDSMRQRVQDLTGYWHNFYQTKTVYLHSGPMSQADANQKVDAGHTDIDGDEGVWRVIADNVESEFAIRQIEQTLYGSKY